MSNNSAARKAFSPHIFELSLGGLMQRKRFSPRALLVALFLLTLLPVSVFAQRRWVVVRPSRSRVVIYQPRQRVIYQQRPYYQSQYYTYGYPQSYYTNRYDS